MTAHQLQVRDDRGTTTAEYAVCTGAATGFAALLFKFLSSSEGQHIISTVFHALLSLLPF